MFKVNNKNTRTVPLLLTLEHILHLALVFLLLTLNMHLPAGQILNQPQGPHPTWAPKGKRCSKQAASAFGQRSSIFTSKMDFNKSAWINLCLGRELVKIFTVKNLVTVACQQFLQCKSRALNHVVDFAKYLPNTLTINVHQNYKNNITSCLFAYMGKLLP